MKDGDLRLVGVLLASSKTLGTYRLESVYRPVGAALRRCVKFRVGVDARMHTDFPHIERAFGDAFAPWILKIWHKKYTKHQATYFQFHIYASPSLVRLPGTWRLWATL